jgi:hypothetical protein
MESSAGSVGDNGEGNRTDATAVNARGLGLGQGLGQDREDEKERTIAKAALSIAELGRFTCMLFSFP